MLVINPGTTQHETTILRVGHKKATRLYRKGMQIEQALIKQVGHALPQIYLKKLQKPAYQYNPNAYSHSIRTSFYYLQGSEA